MQDGAGQNWFGTGVTARTSDNYAYVSPSLSPSDASRIDAKIDDGMPNTGNVQGALLTGGAQDIASPMNSFSTNCASDGSHSNTPAATYQVNNKGLYCNLRFKFQ